MTDRRKIEEALKRIDDECLECLEDAGADAEAMYQGIRDETLFEVAELIADMANTIHDVRHILEG